jgi:hypothetical protein
MAKKYSFKIPIYFGTFTVVIADSISDGLKALGADVNADETQCAITLRRDHLHYAIIILEGEIQRPGVIAHESKHLVNYVFEDRGIRLCVDNDEAECYFLTWVVNTFYKAIHKHLDQIEKAENEKR